MVWLTLAQNAVRLWTCTRQKKLAGKIQVKCIRNTVARTLKFPFHNVLHFKSKEKNKNIFWVFFHKKKTPTRVTQIKKDIFIYLIDYNRDYIKTKSTYTRGTIKPLFF